MANRQPKVPPGSRSPHDHGAAPPAPKKQPDAPTSGQTSPDPEETGEGANIAINTTHQGGEKR